MASTGLKRLDYLEASVHQVRQEEPKGDNHNNCDYLVTLVTSHSLVGDSVLTLNPEEQLDTMAGTVSRLYSSYSPYHFQNQLVSWANQLCYSECLHTIITTH